MKQKQKADNKTRYITAIRLQTSEEYHYYRKGFCELVRKSQTPRKTANRYEQFIKEIQIINKHLGKCHQRHEH